MFPYYSLVKNIISVFWRKSIKKNA